MSQIIFKMPFLKLVLDTKDDHHCWAPPENMKTKKSVKMITSDTPGTEIAAETAAAMRSQLQVKEA